MVILKFVSIRGPFLIFLCSDLTEVRDTVLLISSSWGFWQYMHICTTKIKPTETLRLRNTEDMPSFSSILIKSDRLFQIYVAGRCYNLG